MPGTPKPPVGVKGLTKYQLRTIRVEIRAEERRQFFRDVFIVPWGWDPRFYTLDGILRGKKIPEWRLQRYRALGWTRPLDRSPGYELTCRGEEVYRDELDEVTAGSGRDDDYDPWDDEEDWLDEDDDYPPYWELDDDDDWDGFD